MDMIKAYNTAKGFARLRTAAEWPLQLDISSVQSTIHTGMHWLLRGRSLEGHAVVVFNAARLDLHTAPITEYHKMG